MSDDFDDDREAYIDPADMLSSEQLDDVNDLQNALNVDCAVRGFPLHDGEVYCVAVSHRKFDVEVEDDDLEDASTVVADESNDSEAKKPAPVNRYIHPEPSYLVCSGDGNDVAFLWHLGSSCKVRLEAPPPKSQTEDAPAKKGKRSSSAKPPPRPHPSEWQQPSFQLHKDSVVSCGFSHDDKFVATGGMDGVVNIWKIVCVCLH